MSLYLYKITWSEADEQAQECCSHYDSAIVAAETAEAAKQVHPAGGEADMIYRGFWNDEEWAKSPDTVKAELIGVADPSVKPGVVLASYDAY